MLTAKLSSSPPALVVGAGDDAAIDASADAADRQHSFLRARWFRAASPELDILAAWRPDGTALAAIPLTRRRIGPLRLSEVPGPYWPFRSFPLNANASEDEMAVLLTDPAARRLLGRAWRLGPVYAGDLSAELLTRAARTAGWHVIERRLGTIFELDLAALCAGGDWPKAKTQSKNRWRERRLAEWGELEFEYFTGADWTATQLDAMAEVERKSWISGLADGGDTKFANQASRDLWEAIARDSMLAPLLFGSLMTIGGIPAAFTFGLQTGQTRYYIANNYNEQFGRFGPGKILLYQDLARAAGKGIAHISWGAGDAGYKTEMGAKPGPEVRDLLFVRGSASAAILRPLFARTA